MRRRWILLLAAVALSVPACTGGTSTGSDGAEGRGRAGFLIQTMADGSLSELDIAGGSRRTLARPDPGGFLLYPSVSPDGSRIAYASQPAPAQTGAADSGFDLWTAARDGTERRLVFRHVSPNQQVTSPQWIDAGRLLAIVQEQGPNGVVYTLERFDLASGERVRLREDVLGFGLSADGARVVFTRLTDDAGLTLNLADTTDAPARVISSTRDGLSPFGWPRFSPDGASIAFAAAEVPRVASRTHAVAFGPPRDGAPQDIWQIDPGGGSPRRLADLKEDNPTIAWSADGKHLYVNGARGVFDVDLTNGATDRIGDGTFHGHIAWAP